jgi:hypothetical protein
MTSNLTKDQIINYGIKAGYKGSDINKVLNAAGYSNYNPLTAQTNWENLPANLKKGAKEFARDMRTMGGVIAQPFVDVRDAKPGDKLAKAKESFIKAVNNDALRRTAIGAGTGAVVGSALPIIGTAGGAITGGLVGLLGPKNLANSFLQTYETSVDDINKVRQGKKSASDLATDILQGAMRNPVYSGLDVLSAGGAKTLGNIGRGIGKAIPNTAPIAVQQMFQTPGVREFNRSLTNATQFSKARNAELLEPIERLESTVGVNNEKLVKFIRENEGALTGNELKLGQDIKSALQKGEQKAIEYGLLDKDISRRNVVAQYGMQKLMPVIPDVIEQDIVKYIETSEMSPRMAEAVLKNPELKTYIDNVISDGGKLYDTKDTAFLSQALSPTMDPRGEIIARASARKGAGYFGTERQIGRATDKQLADVLEDSVRYQQGQIAKATEAIDVIEDILKQPGIGKIVKDIKDVPKGSTVINPRVLRENMAKAYQSGTDINISKVLKDSGVAEAGAYIIPNVYFKALDNMFKPIGRYTGSRALNAFKKTVLASPHWFALNRIGNWTNNSMGGVNLVDYLDAAKNGKLIPKQLRQQTSFGSYVGENSGSIQSGFIKPLKNIAKDLKKASKGEKGVGDGIDAIESLVANTSDMFSNPIFRLESAAETMDRYANFIRQAKREAKATKSNWKDVVKKAETDNSLYNKLNNQVNKDLGDYVGRNYLMDNRYYEALRATVPFYRFLTQTGRTSLHQLANHGLAFQSTVLAPAKAGKQFSEDVINKFGLDPETYEGGIPYSKQEDDGIYRYIGAEPLPAAAVINDLLSSNNKLNLISPMYTLGGNIASYKTGFGRTPTSEGLTRYKLERGTTKGYEPTDKERWGYALSQLANTFYAPVRMGRGWMRELGDAVLGRPTLSNYDANILQTNPLSYSKELPVETVGKWFGIQNMPYYPQRTSKPKKPTKWEKANIRKYQEQYIRNTKGR